MFMYDVINILAIFSHVTSFENIPWQRGYFYHKINICHDVRKNINEWKRQQLITSGLDASFI